MANDMSVTQVIEALEGPFPAKVEKILDAVHEHGWSFNPAVSLVMRLSKPEDALAKPFFMRWDLGVTESGKRSWRFQGARAANGQPLNYRDCLVYLEDPSVIYPEPPEGEGNQDA